MKLKNITLLVLTFLSVSIFTVAFQASAGQPVTIKEETVTRTRNYNCPMVGDGTFTDEYRVWVGSTSGTLTVPADGTSAVGIGVNITSGQDGVAPFVDVCYRMSVSTPTYPPYIVFNVSGEPLTFSEIEGHNSEGGTKRTQIMTFSSTVVGHRTISFRDELRSYETIYSFDVDFVDPNSVTTTPVPSATPCPITCFNDIVIDSIKIDDKTYNAKEVAMTPFEPFSQLAINASANPNIKLAAYVDGSKVSDNSYPSAEGIWQQTITANFGAGIHALNIKSEDGRFQSAAMNITVGSKDTQVAGIEVQGETKSDNGVSVAGVNVSNNKYLVYTLLVLVPLALLSIILLVYILIKEKKLKAITPTAPTTPTISL